VREGGQIPEPTELVYVPEPSWLPLITAASVAAIVVGLFSGWVWSAIGALVFLRCVWAWSRSTGDDVSRMPRKQEVVSAVLPAVPPPGGER
jgi:hypothetical protein